MNEEKLAELLAIKAKQAEIAQELRGKVVRAGSWTDIFPSTEEAEAQFQVYMEQTVNWYRVRKTLTEYRIDSHPDGPIHAIVLVYSGHYSTTQRLGNGDVAIVTYYPDSAPSTQTITCSIGNIIHPFSEANLIAPTQEAIRDLINDRKRYSQVVSEIGMNPAGLHQSLEGKPATEFWEDAIFDKGEMPERLGYRIFIHSILEAQRRCRELYPELFPNSEPQNNITF